MSKFCPGCGAPLAENIQHSCRSSASPAGNSAGAADAQMPANANFAPRALASNIAGALAYVAGFVSGIAFLVLEPYRHDRYVRFHAWQSILFSLAWIAFWIPWSILTSTLLTGVRMANAGLAIGGGLPFIAMVITAVNRLLGLAGFVFWLFLLYKAYSGRQFQVPVIGRFANAQAGHE